MKNLRAKRKLNLHGLVIGVSLSVLAGLIITGCSIASASLATKTKRPTCVSCSTGVQTPGAASLYDSIEAGSQLPLAYDATQIGTGGTWASNYGSVDASGNYTAPTFLPPNGIDDVSYTDTSGNFLHVSFFIRPQDNGTAPTAAPIVNYTFTTDAPPAPGSTTTSTTQRTSGTTVNSPTGGVGLTGLQQALLNVTSNAAILPVGTTTVNPPVTLDAASCTAPVESALVPGSLVIPATLNGNPTEALISLPTSQTQTTQKQCVRQGPYGPCQNGTWTSVQGAWQYSNSAPVLIQPGDTLTVTIDLAAQGDIAKLFGITLTLNLKCTINDSYDQITVTASAYKDFYQCVNGTYQYQYTQLCQATKLVKTYVIPWHQYFFGALGGQNWGPTSCHRI